jgi:hypothetical protein
MALAPPSGYSLEVRKGPSTRYHHSETGGDRVKEVDPVAAARAVAGHNESISQLETPKQRLAVPEVNEHNRALAPRNATFPTQAVAKPSAGFDMSYRALERPEPERHSQQADHLRILQDRFGAPGSDRSHWYLDTDEASASNFDDGNFLESFVDANNEGYWGRYSKSVCHSLLSKLFTRASD